jgi:hypothetical protein
LINAAVLVLVQWGDHHITDNWYPHENFADDLGKAAY